MATQPNVTLASILSGLGYVGIQSLLGLSHTAGTISDALPPPRSALLSSFMLPFKPNVKGSSLTCGARALAKHATRSSNSSLDFLSHTWKMATQRDGSIELTVDIFPFCLLDQYWYVYLR